MANKWNNANRWAAESKESLSTRRDWNDSEVAKEFEKQIIDLIIRVGNLAEQQKTAGVIETSKETKENLDQANTSAESLLSTLGEQNFAEDSEDDEEEVDASAADDEITEDEHKKAKSRLVTDLIKLAHEAADSGDTVLAYKIERAVSEIAEEL